MKLTFVFRMAARNVLRHRRRSSIAVTAIAFGIIALLISGGFIEWIFYDFREASIHSQLGHLQVTRSGYRARGGADPFAFLLPARDPAFAELTRDPRVQGVARRLVFNGLVSTGENTVSFLGEGVDPEADRALTRAVTLSAGSALADTDPTGVVVGEGLAANLGVKPGDGLVLLASTKSGATNAVEVKVRGTFFSVTKSYDDATIRMPLVTAQKLLRVDGAQAWIVLLHDTKDTAGVLRALRAKLDPAKLEVTPWWDLADFYNKTVELFTRQLHVVRFIVGAIIVLSISNTMIMNVLERTWEIGTSMAIGVRRREIALLFLCEGLVLGLLGGAVGLVLGTGLAIGLTVIGIPMPPAPGMSHGFTGGIMLTFTLVAGTLLLALATTLLAAFYPANRASRLPIVDALRHNH